MFTLEVSQLCGFYVTFPFCAAPPPTPGLPYVAILVELEAVPAMDGVAAVIRELPYGRQERYISRSVYEDISTHVEVTGEPMEEVQCKNAQATCR